MRMSKVLENGTNNLQGNCPGENCTNFNSTGLGKWHAIYGIYKLQIN